MKVTPVNRKFGKYAPGDEFHLPDKVGRIMVRLKKVSEVTSPMGYQTRMMTAQPAVLVEDAPYGLKADGTPRKRPGRAPASE